MPIIVIVISNHSDNPRGERKGWYHIVIYHPRARVGRPNRFAACFDGLRAPALKAYRLHSKAPEHLQAPYAAFKATSNARKLEERCYEPHS